MSEGIHGAGKGDTYRKIDYQKWSDNWDAIFKPKKKVSLDNESNDNRSEDRRATSKRSSRSSKKRDPS